MDTLYKQLIENGEDEQEARIKSTVFFVAANSYEQLCIWKECRDDYEEDISWVQEAGFLQHIGFIDGDKEKPVNVSFSFNLIEGSRIAFYDVSSRYSDSKMIEDWIKDNYPVKWNKGRRTAMTNAMNFDHAIKHVRAIKSEV